MFEESYKLCKENGETDKYLMTFQNFISRIPKWNSTIIEEERKRICDKSGCGYLEDLITCVHIIQLKILTAMRAGTKQKKIDISIPKLDDFIHRAYIHAARKMYTNVYLFEVNVAPLQVQKNHRETEIIIQECILNALRESIPVETILRAYMEESVEENVVEEIKEEIIPIKEEIPVVPSATPSLPSHTQSAVVSPFPSASAYESANRLKFNDVDYAITSDNVQQEIDAPKTFERLEQVSVMRNEQRKLEEDDDDDNVKLKISTESMELTNLDIHNIEQPTLELMPDLLIDEIEVLT
jgi:hypothetical protein